jgi:hypothetical protein
MEVDMVAQRGMELPGAVWDRLLAVVTLASVASCRSHPAFELSGKT